MMKASTLKIILKNWLLQRRSLGAYIATNTIYRKSDLVVLDGPFKGLNYIENSTGGAYFPKLLGIYEKELTAKINEFSNINFDEIINVGGGEGYFAVGFALNYKNANVLAYEPGFYGCYLMQKMAEKNNVMNRMTIKAQLCFPDDLSKSIQPNKKTLVFMDVEGAELELLNPAVVPGLSNCHIMVEIHDTVSPTLGDTIKQRFANTHKFTEIWQEERTIKDITISSVWKSLLKKQFEKIIHEGRGNKMRWFVFEPNGK
jgi:hypothetical protein